MDKNFYLIKQKSGQLFSDKGQRLAVTYLQIPGTVVLAKNKLDENRWIFKIGIKEKKLAKCKQPQQKLFAKIGCKNGYYHIREITSKKELEVKTGEPLLINELVKEGDWLAVSAKSKGRGFAGVMKRWGFKGGPKTHGQSDRARAIGSIGQRTDPGRVRKGKKMAGHMGNKTKTLRALNVLKIDLDKQTIVLGGMVPGARGSLVTISRLDRKSKKVELIDTQPKKEELNKSNPAVIKENKPTEPAEEKTLVNKESKEDKPNQTNIKKEK